MDPSEAETTTLETARPSIWQRLLASRTTFWGAFFVVGPLAFPLLWKNKKYSRTAKIVITIGCCAVTVLLMKFMVHQVQEAADVLQQLKALDAE